MKAPWLAMLLAVPALAQTLELSDDFETGTLLMSEVPPGKWGSQYRTDSERMDSSVEAAHRGLRGVRLTDTRAASGTNVSASLHLYVDEMVTGDFHARMWMRVVSSNGPHTYVAAMHQRAFNTGSHELAIFGAGPTLQSAGWQRQDIFSTDDVAIPLGNDWHLIEWSMFGVGAAQGFRRAWVDGVQVMEREMDLTGTSLGELHLGEYFSTPAFVGTIDYDDFRAARLPHGSRFEMAVPTQAFAGECVPMVVTLLDSVNRGPAAAPYDVELTVMVDGAVQAFDDDACLQPLSTWRIPAGATQGRFGVRATTAGAAQLRVQHDDFLPMAPVTVTFAERVDAGVAEDGGTEPSVQQQQLRVGCGCSQAEAGWSLLAVAMLLARARRPHHSS